MYVNQLEVNLLRKYVMTTIAPGDYLLPSNDGLTIWRIRRYTEGPSSGLDWPRDRQVWGIWRWNSPVLPTTVDPDDTSMWEFWEGFHDTRAEAMEAALNLN